MECLNLGVHDLVKRHDAEYVLEQYEEKKYRGDAAEQQPDKIRFSLFILVADAVDGDKRRHA